MHLPYSNKKLEIFKYFNFLHYFMADKGYKGRVLVMDDEEAVRGMLNSLLKKKEYNVDLAAEGETAIELYKQAKKSNNPFDVVILDLENDIGMGGLQTIKKLLEFDPKVYSIVYSTNYEIMTNYASYGFRSAVNKPGIQELCSTLNDIVESR